MVRQIARRHRMSPPACLLFSGGGMTVLEVIVALFFFTVGVLAVTGMQVVGMRSSVDAAIRGGNCILAGDTIEKILSLPYTDPTLGRSRCRIPSGPPRLWPSPHPACGGYGGMGSGYSAGSGQFQKDLHHPSQKWCQRLHAGSIVPLSEAKVPACVGIERRRIVPPEHKVSFRTCQPSTGPGGSAIVVVLLVTAALTVLGVMSINSGLIELQLVRNGKECTKRFYLAESAALEGIQRIADTSAIDLEDKTLHWHHAMVDVERSEIDFRKPGCLANGRQGRG
jgi:hypothetical protein